MAISRNAQRPSSANTVMRFRGEGEAVPPVDGTEDRQVIDLEVDSSGNILTPESTIPVNP